MQDSTRSSAAGRERASVQGSNVAAPGRSRRRWSAEEKARVVRASSRPGKRVGEVAQRYGVSRWQLSTWRSLARQGKLTVASSDEPVGVEPQPQPAFATLEVDSATGAMGSDVIESREVAVRLDGAIDASRVAEIASVLRGASMHVAGTGMRVVVAPRPVDFRKGHDGLAAVVEHELGPDPYSGVAVVFRSKRLDRLGSAGLAPRLFGVRPRSEPLRRALRHADRCEVYRPLAAKQPSDLAGSGAALGLLDDPQPVLGGELAPGGLGHDLRVWCPARLSGLGPGGLVAALLVPQGRRVSVHPRHGLSVCSHRCSPPPPSLIPRVPGVSTMLAERGWQTRVVGDQMAGVGTAAARSSRSSGLVRPA